MESIGKTKLVTSFKVIPNRTGEDEFNSLVKRVWECIGQYVIVERLIILAHPSLLVDVGGLN